MSAQPLEAVLARRIEQLGEKTGAPTSWVDVRDVVESILTTVEGDFYSEDVTLFAEVEALAQFIQTAKNEIASLRPEQIGTDQFVAATDELDAVVSATEDATNVIMEAAETIEEVGERLDNETADALNGATTRIYEACGFQDITGQRIGKVVAALKEIESRVDAIVTTFEEGGERAVARRQRAAEHVARAATGSIDPNDLLQGPQLPSQANNQDDIDALFDSND